LLYSFQVFGLTFEMPPHFLHSPPFSHILNNRLVGFAYLFCIYYYNFYGFYFFRNCLLLFPGNFTGSLFWTTMKPMFVPYGACQIKKKIKFLLLVLHYFFHYCMFQNVRSYMILQYLCTELSYFRLSIISFLNNLKNALSNIRAYGP
jgi:hypothetical protein